MRQREAGGLWRGFLVVLTTCALLALLGVVGYLVSDINARHYRLRLAGGALQVERGRFFPLGYVAYVPDDEQLRRAYAPIPVPPGEPVPTDTVFDERSEVDRALYSRLSSWARPRLLTEDPIELHLAVQYVRRLEILPSLSEGQRQELRTIRANAALRQGESLLRGVLLTLHEAKQLFEQALELGTGQPDRARAGLAQINEKLDQLGAQPTTAQPMTPSDLPAAMPTTPPAPHAPPILVPQVH